MPGKEPATPLFCHGPRGYEAVQHGPDATSGPCQMVEDDYSGRGVTVADAVVIEASDFTVMYPRMPAASCPGWLQKK